MFTHDIITSIVRSEGGNMKENASLFEDKEKLAMNKLIILYVMKKVDYPLSNAQILRLLYDIEGFNYYYFQHILSDLIEQKYVINYQQEDEWLYEITAEGINVFELTENMLPGITKYKIDAIINSIIKEVKNDTAVTAEYIPEGNKAYITKCKITEAHRTLFEINVFCSTQDQAKLIAENWKKNANTIYPSFIELLTKKD